LESAVDLLNLKNESDRTTKQHPLVIPFTQAIEAIINPLFGKASNMYQDVLKFWFEDTEPAQWWKKDEDFDRIIIERFSALIARDALRTF